MQVSAATNKSPAGRPATVAQTIRRGGFYLQVEKKSQQSFCHRSIPNGPALDLQVVLPCCRQLRGPSIKHDRRRPSTLPRWAHDHNSIENSSPTILAHLSLTTFAASSHVPRPCLDSSPGLSHIPSSLRIPPRSTTMSSSSRHSSSRHSSSSTGESTAWQDKLEGTVHPHSVCFTSSIHDTDTKSRRLPRVRHVNPSIPDRLGQKR